MTCADAVATLEWVFPMLSTEEVDDLRRQGEAIGNDLIAPDFSGFDAADLCDTEIATRRHNAGA